MKYETVSIATMRESDAWTIENLVPSQELMKRAGEGIFASVVTVLNGWKSPVAVICGKGNNAGDGFVVASCLKEAGYDVVIYLLYPDSFSEDGLFFFNKCKDMQIPYENFTEITDLSKFSFIVDCILGTGIRGNVSGLSAVAINAINNSGAVVISADINSGLNGDTGEGDPCVHSDLTVSIGTYKFGHFRGNASQVMKNKTNVDIGIVIKGEIVYTEECR